MKTTIFLSVLGQLSIFYQEAEQTCYQLKLFSTISQFGTSISLFVSLYQMIDIAFVDGSLSSSFFLLIVNQSELAECHDIGHSPTPYQENTEVREGVLHVVANGVPHSDTQLLPLMEVLPQNNQQVDNSAINLIFYKETSTWC